MGRGRGGRSASGSTVRGASQQTRRGHGRPRPSRRRELGRGPPQGGHGFCRRALPEPETCLSEAREAAATAASAPPATAAAPGGAWSGAAAPAADRPSALPRPSAAAAAPPPAPSTARASSAPPADAAAARGVSSGRADGQAENDHTNRAGNTRPTRALVDTRARFECTEESEKWRGKGGERVEDKKRA